jgi:hypothetical protein
VASQADVSAGSIALQDSPVLVLPPGDANLPIFLNLPKKALEVLLLLRNAKPDYKRFSLGDDTPVHRLFDLLHGVIDTNAFGGTGIYGKVGIMLLAGSMFNHSDTPNLTRAWDDGMTPGSEI